MRARPTPRFCSSRSTGPRRLELGEGLLGLLVGRDVVNDDDVDRLRLLDRGDRLGEQAAFAVARDDDGDPRRVAACRCSSRGMMAGERRP